MKKNDLTQQGVATIDVVFAIGIATIALVAMATLVGFSRNGFEQSIDKNKASMLAQEGLGGARLLGKQDFGSLILTGADKYGINFDTVTSAWKIESCASDVCKIGAYERTISISSIDAESKKVAVKVVWQTNKFLEYANIITAFSATCSNAPCPAP